ncbi:MAG: cation:proton antiporter [Lachnospiraceae bacterium]
MTTYKFLLDIALILLFTKALGIATRNFHIPQVVGALIGGVVLGPAIMGLVEESDIIRYLSEIGVILLMFIAGMETDIKGLIRNGKSSFIIAVIGVIIPIYGGMQLGHISSAVGDRWLDKVFIGIVLSATSVSITVATLKEMGKLNTKISDTLLGAAIIDDIIGIIALAAVSGFSNLSGGENDANAVWITILNVVLFCAFAVIMWVVFSNIFSKWFAETEDGLQRYAIIATAVCFLFSFAAEYLFGVANIIGAFLAGLIFSDNSKNSYILRKCDILSYMFFAPMFFAGIGLKVNLQSMDGSILLFAVLLTVVAIITKLIGCGAGAKICGFDTKESLIIGSGMVSRGEVALIVANKGIEMGFAGTTVLPAVILMVLATTIVAPILIKQFYR